MTKQEMPIEGGQGRSPKRLVLFAVIAAVVLAVGIAAVSRIRPSADEELSQMKSIVSEYTEEDGYMQPEYYEIGDSDAAEIDKAADEAMSSSIDTPADPPEDSGTGSDPIDQTPSEEPHTSVNIRDWQQYRSDYSYSRMTGAEQSLFTRLESVAEAYMNSSELDATYTESKGLYTTYSVRYGDLEISRQTAVNLSQWFIFCNPQYWFLKPTVMSTSSTLYIGIYDIAADGDDRAEITNRLFSVVDDWSSSAAGASTAYQKVTAIHDRVISEVGYANSQYDQSVYSAFIDRTTVCAGYSGAMTMMLNSLGVKTVTAASSNHAWNLVQMEDGNWYGLDATWDDSLGSRDFLLVSGTDLTVLDTANEAHDVEPYAAGWVPQIASQNYMASAYDNTGVQQDVSVPVPTNLQVEYIDETHGRFKWDKASGVNGYDVQIYNGAVLSGSTSLTGQSVKLSGLGQSTMTLKVRAYAGTGNGNVYSDWASIQYTHVQGGSSAENQSVQAPAVPSNVRVLGTEETYVRVGWDKESDITRYEVSAYRDANLTSQLLHGSVDASSVKLSGLTAGSDVYVQVRAVQTVNGVDYCSDWATVSARTTEPAPPAVLDAPTGISYTVSSDTSARVTWDSVTNAYQYEIQVFWNGGFTGNPSASTSLSGTALSLTKLPAGSTCYVRVRAVGTVNGQQLQSEWTTTAVTLEAANPEMSAPSSFSAEKVSSSACRLTWDSVDDASKYEIQVSYSADFSKISASTTVTGTSLRLSALGSSTYYVRVRACGTVGGQYMESDWVTTSYKK